MQLFLLNSGWKARSHKTYQQVILASNQYCLNYTGREMEVWGRRSHQQQMGIFCVWMWLWAEGHPGSEKGSEHPLATFVRFLSAWISSLAKLAQEALPGHLGKGGLRQKGTHPRRMFHHSPWGECKPSGLCFLQCNSTFCPVAGHQVPDISATPLWCKAVRVQPTPTLVFMWCFSILSL